MSSSICKGTKDEEHITYDFVVENGEKHYSSLRVLSGSGVPENLKTRHGITIHGTENIKSRSFR